MLNRQLAWVVVTGTIGAALLSAQLQLPDATLQAGGSAVVPISLQGSTSISGVQFDLEYDRAALKVEVISGEAIRSSAKQFYVADVDQRQRVLITGENINVFADGMLVFLQVSTDPTTAPNRYPMRVVNMVATSPDADEVPLTSRDAVIQVDSRSGEVPSELRVMNAASFVAGPITPGEIITAMGESFGTDANSSDVICLIDGVSAPIIHLDSNRFSAIVPDSLTPDSVVTLQLRRRGTRILASTTLLVIRSAPGIFTNPSTGAGQAVATHEDGSLNSVSNPVERGSVLKLFVTGTGVNNAVAVRSGATNWEVLSADADLSIPGVTTVLARVPSELEPGPTIGVIIETAGSRSQDGVTVAVR